MMTVLPFIGLIIFSHGMNHNQQRLGIVPLMWFVVHCKVVWHSHVAGCNFEEILHLILRPKWKKLML